MQKGKQQTQELMLTRALIHRTRHAKSGKTKPEKQTHTAVSTRPGLPLFSFSPSSAVLLFLLFSPYSSYSSSFHGGEGSALARARTRDRSPNHARGTKSRTRPLLLTGIQGGVIDETHVPFDHPSIDLATRDTFNSYTRA